MPTTVHRFDKLTTTVARAQDPTPTTSPATAGGGDTTEFLFVQTFASGIWAPKAGEDGVFLLTLTGASAQTVYFSDRPERIVGTVPTPRFLDGLGFTPTNPPNAALVVQVDEGEDVVVIELRDPVYTEDFGPEEATTLTYEAKVLAEYTEAGLAHLAARQTDATIPATFGPASLFIDDCPDAKFYCIANGPKQELGVRGLCWNWDDWLCEPCSDHRIECNDTFPDYCGGRCAVCNDGIYGTCVG
jgi:hypothetical protein